MREHLQFKLSKTELLVFPADLVIPQNINIQLGPFSLTLTKTEQNLGLIIDERLYFSEHVASQNLIDLHLEDQTLPLTICYTIYCAEPGYFNKIDYCNSILMNPSSNERPSAARDHLVLN